MLKMFPVHPVGENRTFTPGVILPCSTRPVTTSPTPLILYTPDTGIRNAFLSLRFGGFATFSRASTRVCPATFSFFTFTEKPLYQGMFLETSARLSPWKPLIG